MIILFHLSSKTTTSTPKITATTTPDKRPHQLVDLVGPHDENIVVSLKWYFFKPGLRDDFEGCFTALKIPL
jgi:hypothetical protein